MRGLSAQQIADSLFLSRRTVEKHFEAIYATLHVNTRAQAIAATTATQVPVSEAEPGAPNAQGGNRIATPVSMTARKPRRS